MKSGVKAKSKVHQANQKMHGFSSLAQAKSSAQAQAKSKVHHLNKAFQLAQTKLRAQTKAREGGECEDMGGVDTFGDGCDWYDANPDGCGFYDWEEFVSEEECCACGGGHEFQDTSTGEGNPDEPLWYEFVTNDDIGTWAVIATWSEMYDEFFLLTSGSQVCFLTPDWESGSDTTMGINVHQTDMLNGCPFIEEDGYDYTTVTFDYEGPTSVTGPWGNQWNFVSPDDFEANHPDWYDQFNSIIEGEDQELECIDGDGVDSYGDGCDWYWDYPEGCGGYDTAEFSANDECCACMW